MVFVFLLGDVFGGGLVVFCKALVGGHNVMCVVSCLSCSIGVPKGCIHGPCFGFNY